MEDSYNRKYVNISNKPFEHRVYNKEEEPYYQYKPLDAFWLSLESENPEFLSQWDEEYGSVYQPDKNGNLHATTVKLKSTTYVLSPEQDKTLLEGFNNFVKNKESEGQKLTNDQRRKLLAELVKKREGRNIEHVICQIDTLEDVDAVEEIFGDYKFGEENSKEKLENLVVNVKNGFKKNFSGLEVTGYALDSDCVVPHVAAEDELAYRRNITFGYAGGFDYFDMHSMAIFDTSCLDIVKQIEFPARNDTIISNDEDYDRDEI